MTFLKSNISRMVRLRNKVTIEHWWDTIPNLLNGKTFNDLEWHLTGISRSRYFSTLNISETIRDIAIVTRTSIGIHMRSIEWWHFQWPWRTPNPVFTVTTFLKSNISYGQSYYSTLIGNHAKHIEWYHVWWSWLTSKRVARFVSDSWVSCF